MVIPTGINVNKKRRVEKNDKRRSKITHTRSYTGTKR